MIDFNHSNPSKAINFLVDSALQRRKAAEPPRKYLGGSRLGQECERKLQFEYTNTPRDEQYFKVKSCKAFDYGHVVENLVAKWLKLAGFELVQAEQHGQRLGKQFEASISFLGIEGTPVMMHCDGKIIAGPAVMQYPALWECKTMMAKYWQKCRDNGVMTEHPDYYGQVQVYMKMFGLVENPALFTAINKDSLELYHELIPYAPKKATAFIKRGERVVKASWRGVLLPRISKSPSFYKCKPAWCDWSQYCWGLKD